SDAGEHSGSFSLIHWRKLVGLFLHPQRPSPHQHGAAIERDGNVTRITAQQGKGDDATITEGRHHADTALATSVIAPLSPQPSPAVLGPCRKRVPTPALPRRDCGGP